MYKEGKKFCHRVLSVMEQKLFYRTRENCCIKKFQQT